MKKSILSIAIAAALASGSASATTADLTGAAVVQSSSVVTGGTTALTGPSGGSSTFGITGNATNTSGTTANLILSPTSAQLVGTSISNGTTNTTTTGNTSGPATGLATVGASQGGFSGVNATSTIDASPLSGTLNVAPGATVNSTTTSQNLNGNPVPGFQNASSTTNATMTGTATVTFVPNTNPPTTTTSAAITNTQSIAGNDHGTLNAALSNTGGTVLSNGNIIGLSQSAPVASASH